MTQPTEQFLTSAKTAMADLNDMAATALAGFEKLVELNLATAKTAMADTTEQVKSAFAAKAPQDLTAGTGKFRPAEAPNPCGRRVARNCSMSMA